MDEVTKSEVRQNFLKTPSPLERGKDPVSNIMAPKQLNNPVHPRKTRPNPFTSFQEPVPKAEIRPICSLDKMLPALATMIHSYPVTIFHSGLSAGKSTVIPHCLIKAFVARQYRMSEIILCEPNEVAAIGVADRMAKLCGEQIGKTIGVELTTGSKSSCHTILKCMSSDMMYKKLTSSCTRLSLRDRIIIMDELQCMDTLTSLVLVALRDMMVRDNNFRMILMTNAAVLDPQDWISFFKFSFIIQPLYPKDLNLIEFPLEDTLATINLNLKGAVLEGKNPECDDGSGAIHFHNLDEIIHLALIREISVNIRCKNGKTLLMTAADGDNRDDYVRQLLNFGADVSTSADSSTVFNYAGNLEKNTKDLLVSYGNMSDRSTFLQLTLLERKKIVNKQLSPHLEAYLKWKLDENGIDYNLILAVLAFINTQGQGDVLVFLPSLHEILRMRDLLFANADFFKDNGGPVTLRYLYKKNQWFDPFACSGSQARTFILSTNLGSVGFVITGVKYIVDTELDLKIVYNKGMNRSEWKIMQTSAVEYVQRKSRIASDAFGGIYFSLAVGKYEEKTQTIVSNLPGNMVLKMKKLYPNEPLRNILNQVVEPSERKSFLKAEMLLKEIEAVDMNDDGKMTELGKLLCELPVEPQFGKMIIMGVALKCLDPILTIAAFSTQKSIFDLMDEDKMNTHLAFQKWRKAVGVWGSDHLLLVKIFMKRQWLGDKGWDDKLREKYFVSNALIEEVGMKRLEIVGCLRAMGIVRTTPPRDMSDLNKNSHQWVLVKAAMAAAMYPNFLIQDSHRSYLGMAKGRFGMNPLSVLYNHNRNLRCSGIVEQNSSTKFIMFNDLKEYSDGSCIVSQCTAVTAFMVAIFAGSNHALGEIVNSASGEIYFQWPLNDYIRFEADKKMDQEMRSYRDKWFFYLNGIIKEISNRNGNSFRAYQNFDLHLKEMTKALVKYESAFLYFPKVLPKDPTFIAAKPSAFSIKLLDQPKPDNQCTQTSFVNHTQNYRKKDSKMFVIKNVHLEWSTLFRNNVFMFGEKLTAHFLTLKKENDIWFLFTFDNGETMQGLGALVGSEPVKSPLEGSPSLTCVNFFLKESRPLLAILPPEHADYLKTLPHGMEIHPTVARKILHLIPNPERNIQIYRNRGINGNCQKILSKTEEIKNEN